jgi:2-iminobutanoate/2-iminopropanoate deaminase
MPKQIIRMSKSNLGLTKIVRPFSAAVRGGDFIFVSGFHGGGSNPQTGQKYNTIESQTQQCIERIKQALEAAGASLSDVVKITVFIDSSENFEKMNSVYQEYFQYDPPARSAVVTQFVRPGMLIQMDCVAYDPQK